MGFVDGDGMGPAVFPCGVVPDMLAAEVDSTFHPLPDLRSLYCTPTAMLGACLLRNFTGASAVKFRSKQIGRAHV